MITVTEVNQYLDTAAGQGKTTAEAVALLTAQKIEIAGLLNPEPVYDPVARLAELKAERAEWGQAWRKWDATAERKEIRVSRMAKLDQEIANVEQQIATAGQ